MLTVKAVAGALGTCSSSEALSDSESEPVAKKRLMILDNYALVIKRVTNPVTEAFLEYSIGHQHIVGSSFTVQLPKTEEEYSDFKPTCKIQIEYETSPDSPALYWLTPAQTADGTHPFLLSNNKLTFARAVFPCQDTPSVKFSYTATIIVPKDFTVVMSALSQNVFKNSEVNLYNFLQAKQVASYAVIIAVGSLQKKHLSIRSNVFAEKKFINEAVYTFRTGVIEKMLDTAEDLCGSYFWDRYDICVLPPCLGHFEIECPCITFFSSNLLYGDDCSISSLALNIAQSWAGHLVTCTNYNHFWLHKSFSMFVGRKIICKIWTLNETQLFYKKLSYLDLNRMIDISSETNSLKNLVPDLTGLLPINFIRHVPYELGCMFLDNLETNLGGSLIFEEFLKSYFYNFAYKSIKTDDWKEYLNKYFAKIVNKKNRDVERRFFTCEQLIQKLINRKNVVFHHANALLQHSWDMLPHPPYSPVLAPSDFHLFRSLQNSLNGKTCASEDLIKQYLDKFLAEKDGKFYERGIIKLPGRWQKVIEKNGQYIID
ncbi:Leukotriene A-4 hydrolase [Atta colombica]|uniref:Leukotriene A-4 hydrolase n=1 Tax=Atta colombica TaxID=520822 RepID=A0A195BTQ1_9HYME|nr:Leukotriene A-4 hydrolase [Atta colombica]